MAFKLRKIEFLRTKRPKKNLDTSGSKTVIKRSFLLESGVVSTLQYLKLKMPPPCQAYSGLYKEGQ